MPLVADNRMRLNELLDQIPLLSLNIAHSDEQHEAIVMAILAGDGLLTLAFEILSEPATHPDPAVRSELVLELAGAKVPFKAVAAIHPALPAADTELTRGSEVRISVGRGGVGREQ